MCETNDNGVMTLDEEKLPTPIIELFEGSTYENKDNLEPDFIKTLEASYHGQMRDRFLMGQWASYEGLVYPDFSEMTHVMSHHSITEYYKKLVASGANITYLEGYDYGLAVPYCYLCGFVDDLGNVFLLDGGYQKEVPIDMQILKIKECRNEYHMEHSNHSEEKDQVRRLLEDLYLICF